MKKVLIINQNKGGVGKSFLTALLLEKFKMTGVNASCIDIDSGNRSTYKRFQDKDDYSNLVHEFSLIKGDSIDKGLFNDLFESFSGSEKDLFLLDLGGNESRELLSLFKIIGMEDIEEFFAENNLEVEFLTVVKSGDKDCLDHLVNVNNLLKKSKVKQTVFVNSISFDSETNISYENLQLYCKSNKIELKTFGRVPSGYAEDSISEYVRSGFNTKLGMFKGLFRGLIEHVNV